MIGPFTVYVVVDPKGDRPYVSTTMTEEFLDSVTSKGCKVSKIQAEVVDGGEVVLKFPPVELQLRLAGWGPGK